MKKSITQQAPYGCGIACFAFVADITYEQAAEFLGRLNVRISNSFAIVGT